MRKDLLMYFLMFVWPLSSLQRYKIGGSLLLLGKEYPVVLPIIESPNMCYVLIGFGIFLLVANLGASEFDVKTKTLAVKLARPLVVILQRYHKDVGQLKKEKVE